MGPDRLHYKKSPKQRTHCWSWHHPLCRKDVVHLGQYLAHNKCSANVDFIDCLLLADFLHCYKVKTSTIRDMVPDLKLTIQYIQQLFKI